MPNSLAHEIDGLIAIPCAVQARWSSFWASVQELDLPPRVDIRTGRGCSPAANRNGLIAEALRRGASWVWFLDDDLAVPPDALRRLLRRFDDPTVEAVVPLSFRRQAPFSALWFQRSEAVLDAMVATLPPPGALVPLTDATFGGMLVRTSVLRRIPPPWVTMGQIHPEEWCDDLYFCRQMAAAGVQLWGDSSVVLGHTTDVEIWPHYSPELGWSVVFARGTEPFLMQPWGDPASEGDPQHGPELRDLQPSLPDHEK